MYSTPLLVIRRGIMKRVLHLLRFVLILFVCTFELKSQLVKEERCPW